MKTARSLALDILHRVFEQGEYASLLLQEELQSVDAIDQSFVTALVYTTLQHQLFLRAQWQVYATRKPRAKLALLLDMACAQAFLLDKIPSYALVNESVELAKTFASDQEVKWVNRVLRSVTHAGVQLVDESTLEGLSVNLSMPLWILKMWIKQYGRELAIDMAKSLLKPAKVYARVNSLKMDEQLLLVQPDIHAGDLCDTALSADFNWVSTKWFEKGEIWIQDQSSQYVAQQLDVQPEHRVLDVCSAPGTKAALNQVRVKNKAYFDMVELHPHRVELIDEQIKRLGLMNMHVHTMDARDIPSQFKEAIFDRILVDAPCSGLGVVRRKAEIKYRLKPEDIDSLTQLQAEILSASASVLKPGGILIYATCTLNKKENEGQVEKFLEREAAFELISEETLYPQLYESDGFYYAKLKRMK